MSSYNFRTTAQSTEVAKFTILYFAPQQSKTAVFLLRLPLFSKLCPYYCKVYFLVLQDFL